MKYRCFCCNHRQYQLRHYDANELSSAQIESLSLVAEGIYPHLPAAHQSIIDTVLNGAAPAAVIQSHPSGQIAGALFFSQDQMFFVSVITDPQLQQVRNQLLTILFGPPVPMHRPVASPRIDQIVISSANCPYL